MLKFGEKVVKHRKGILLVCLLLLIPSVLGMIGTRINYDVLTYLPDDIETIKGQDILLDDFGKGAFSMVMTEGLSASEKVKLENQIEEVAHVASVISYETMLDASIPEEVLPNKYQEAIKKGDTSLMAIFFDSSTSADETMEAIEQIRHITSKQCFISGMSAVVTDTKNLAEHEEPIYVMIAVALAAIVLAVCMDSYIIPLIFLIGIGMEILYNLGSNYFMGEISYVTKALSAVLQLGVTMDYSIFLWHSYQEECERLPGDKQGAMAQAIRHTITSVSGSSITTIAGFIALCFMTYKLGLDLGIVMAKGVIFGVVGSVTILPAMILVFDQAIERTMHREIIPEMDRPAAFIIRHSKLFGLLFIVLLIPALMGYTRTDVYYNLDASLPKNLDSIIANEKLDEEFDIGSTYMILANSQLPTKTMDKMAEEIEAAEGVNTVLGMNSVLGPAVPKEMVPEKIRSELQQGGWQLLIINSKYKVATGAVSKQIKTINQITRNYDPQAMVIGEAPCTKDLISITNRDFKVVSLISIIAIFIIIAINFKSASLPIILVAVIQLAIFINMGIPYYTSTRLPFIASICIGTIQLGATVDYAILMTTRFRREIQLGKERTESVQIALRTSIPSIIVSALCFFAATFGVGIYSDIDIISSLCGLMARGALISMAVVIFILPAMLVLFHKFICATSKRRKLEMKSSKRLAAVLCLMLAVGSLCPVYAADKQETAAPSKEETVYIMAGDDGAVKKIIVSEWLKNTGEKSLLKDYTELKEIENVKGEETFDQKNGDGAWRAARKDIYYQGEIQKELPVQMKVSYDLDGQKVSAKELKGKSGEVKIRFDYTNNQKQNGVYVPFVVMTSMSLDNEKFTNVEVTNGKVINDGQKSLVVGYALPGLTESLDLGTSDVSIPDHVEVTCKAEKFALDGTMSVATSNLLSDLEVGKIKSMDDLKAALDKLQSAASKLQDGSVKLQSGAEVLHKGTGTLYSGTKTLKEKVSQLSAGLKAAKDGSAQLQASSKKLETGAGRLTEGAKELQGGVKQLGRGLDSAIGGLDQTINGDKKVLAGLKQAQAAMGPAGAALDDAIRGLEETIAGQEKVKQGLTDGKSGTAKLVKGAGDLVNGSSELKNGLGDLAGGAKDLNTGITSAYKGSGLMEEATGQLTKGAGKVNQGAGSLKTGARDLASGIARFKSDGLDKLSQVFNGDIAKISERLKSLQQAAKDYQSFAGKKAETQGSVKFIYKTDEI